MIRNNDKSFSFTIQPYRRRSVDVQVDVTPEGIRLNQEDEAVLPWEDIDKARKLIEQEEVTNATT